MTSKPARTAIAAVPVVLVNAVAFAGQLAFLREHLPWPLAGQVAMAIALKSVAVYLAYHAHVAQLANDSALRLRLAAYGFALVIGAMNYSHWAAPGWHPTFTGVATGLMSAASPWLWSVHSRRVSRDALLARGLIEPHALLLGVTPWAWHPLRSARVMWHATWAGVTDPREAVALWGGQAGQPAGQRSMDAPEAPADVNAAVRMAYAASVASGAPVSQRQLADRFGVSRRRVAQLVGQTAPGDGQAPPLELAGASLNGHGTEPVQPGKREG